MKKKKLWSKANRFREIAHHYNVGAKEWFGKYMKYKRHEETRITSLLQRHFPLSNIAGYNLAQDKIINLWDVQRSEQRIEAEKETRSSTFGMFRGVSRGLKLRKRGRNSLRKKLPSPRVSHSLNLY